MKSGLIPIALGATALFGGLYLLRRAVEELEHCCQALQGLLKIAPFMQNRLERIDGRLDLTQLWAFEHLPGYPRAHSDIPRPTVAQARAAGIPEAGAKEHANGL